MSDEPNDDEEKSKPRLRALEEFDPDFKERGGVELEGEETFDTEEEALDFQEAKEKKADEEGSPVLSSKFDFMNGKDFMLMKIENHGGRMEVHYHQVQYLVPPMFSGGGIWYESCVGFKKADLRFYDWLFGINSLEEKIEKVAGNFMKELKGSFKLVDEMKKLNEKFSLNNK